MNRDEEVVKKPVAAAIEKNERSKSTTAFKWIWLPIFNQRVKYRGPNENGFIPKFQFGTYKKVIRSFQRDSGVISFH